MTCNIKTRSIHLLFLIIACGMAVVSCRKDELELVEKTPCEPLLTALSFKASSNPYQLVEDVRCEIIGIDGVGLGGIIDNRLDVREVVPSTGGGPP